MIAAQIPVELSVAVDVWISEHPEPKPSRSDVLRLALEKLVGSKGVASQRPEIRWERGAQSPAWR
jgi:hypothetical protein